MSAFSCETGALRKAPDACRISYKLLCYFVFKNVYLIVKSIWKGGRQSGQGHGCKSEKALSDAAMSEIKRMKASGHQLSPECLSHYAQVENMYMALQSFYLLLSREQAEIIRLHFVGKLTWEAMEIEYEKKWGKMNAKNIRTMKTYQAQAFEIIAAFIDTHREYYDYSWLDKL